MPPKQRITREMILETSFSMYCREGMENVNARSVAKALNCSTQPIFSYFTGMDELKNALESKAWMLFNDMLSAALEEEQPMRACALAYYRFSVEQPHLFRSLFLTRRNKQERQAIGMSGEVNARLADIVSAKEGVDVELARKKCLMARIYVHGLASLEAMDLLGVKQEDAEAMIEEEMKDVDAT